MKLSVVIPVYNGADFIQKSYQMILSQNIDSFEIIYVDNNSTDHTLKNINRLAASDPRVKTLIQEKSGAAAARNMGILNALGDYVYVFDVDDEIYPNALLKMINVLDDNLTVDAVFGRMVKSSKGISETLKPEGETFEVIIKDTPFWGLTWFRDLRQVVGPPAFLYRKTVFEFIGMYNESIKNNEDTAFDIKLGMTKKIAFIDMFVYLYFKHENSTIEISKKKMSRAFMVWPRLVHEHLPFYLNHKTPDQFRVLLFKQLYRSMGRQLKSTKDISNRIALKKQLFHDVSSIKIPFIIRIYLSILITLPFNILLKIYVYYIVPYVVKKSQL
ncbi:glycosyltransferase family 2 protein [uncultured Psychroserpens sp.]|uniref:glycosyltransferase family 2 protein n=1 Tax=uncultured Psychroserpens sp. TaxID=255436 RepID=UPI002606405D|nr:glycosyltransferase family 2 protein [uncultured Psychroserpens sp.]